jgi:hypothetical protein
MVSPWLSFLSTQPLVEEEELTNGISNSNYFSVSCSQQLTRITYQYQSALSVLLLCIIPYSLSMLLCIIPYYLSMLLCIIPYRGVVDTFFFFRNLKRQHFSMILFIIASIVIVVAIPTTRENGVMAFSCRPSLAAALPRRRHSTPPPHYAASSASQQQQPLLDAILFDCDGVLADTERDGHRISFNMAFASFGIDEVWDEERYGKLLAVGGGKERMVAHWVRF